MIAAVDKLSIHYGKRAAVDGLSFELHAGEIALLLGPNGAGKSTTLAAMAGAVLPSAGTITVAGEDLASAPRSARRKVGFADQPPALYEFFTVGEHENFAEHHEKLLRSLADRSIRSSTYGRPRAAGGCAAILALARYMHRVRLYTAHVTICPLTLRHAQRSRHGTCRNPMGHDHGQ